MTISTPNIRPTFAGKTPQAKPLSQPALRFGHDSSCEHGDEFESSEKQETAPEKPGYFGRLATFLNPLAFTEWGVINNPIVALAVGTAAGILTGGTLLPITIPLALIVWPMFTGGTDEAEEASDELAENNEAESNEAVTETENLATEAEVEEVTVEAETPDNVTETQAPQETEKAQAPKEEPLEETEKTEKNRKEKPVEETKTATIEKTLPSALLKQNQKALADSLKNEKNRDKLTKAIEANDPKGLSAPLTAGFKIIQAMAFNEFDAMTPEQGIQKLQDLIENKKLNQFVKSINEEIKFRTQEAKAEAEAKTLKKAKAKETPIEPLPSIKDETQFAAILIKTENQDKLKKAIELDNPKQLTTTLKQAFQILKRNKTLAYDTSETIQTLHAKAVKGTLNKFIEELNELITKTPLFTELPLIKDQKSFAKTLQTPKNQKQLDSALKEESSEGLSPNLEKAFSIIHTNQLMNQVLPASQTTNTTKIIELAQKEELNDLITMLNGFIKTANKALETKD